MLAGGAAVAAPDGWEALSGSWSESDGTIVGRADAEAAWLISDDFYWDFALSVEFKTPAACNGGVQFRSHWLPNPENPAESQFYGYQANIETRTDDGTGSIIDENGRGRLVLPSPEAQEAVNPTDWNTMRIEARGGVVDVWVNGVRANTLYDEAFIGGRLGLQVMPLDDGEAEIHYRNIEIEDYGRLGDWTSLFDGESLDGWTVYGTEEFVVEDGAILGRSGPNKGEGYLLTDGSWTDFRVRGEFEMLGEGNFGMFYRSTIPGQRDDGGPRISGIQGEVAPGRPGPSGWHYESYRRGWLHEKPQMDSIRAYALNEEGWSWIEIRAVGNRITSWINGIQVVDFYDDHPQVFEGGFALQLHAGGVEGIRWREIYVAEPGVGMGQGGDQ